MPCLTGVIYANAKYMAESIVPKVTSISVSFWYALQAESIIDSWTKN